MNGPSAETAYLFRHALLRDAGYQLMPPTDRAHLHGIALDVLEALIGGRPPADPMCEDRIYDHQPEPLDEYSQDLAFHAFAASSVRPDLEPVRRLYLYRAAFRAESRHEQAEAWRLWAELAEATTGPERGAALMKAGNAAAASGAAAQAEPLLREALALSQAPDSPFHMAAMGNMASYLFSRSRMDEAKSLYQALVAMARRTGRRIAEGRALVAMAHVYARAGQPEQADTYYQQAFSVLEQGGDETTLARALDKYGFHLHRCGKLQEAARTYRRSHQILETAGDEIAAMRPLGNLALLDMESGHPQQARRTFEQLRRDAARLGARSTEYAAMANLCVLALRDADLDTAETLAVQTRANAQEAGMPHLEGHCLALQADVALRRGHLEGALLAAQAAVQACRRARYAEGEAQATLLLAQALADSGRHPECEKQLAAAMAIAQRARLALLEGQIGAETALAAVARGDLSAAQGLWAEALAKLRALGAASELDTLRQRMRTKCLDAAAPLLEEPGGPA